MSELVVPGTSQAYVAQGRWVAMCGYYPWRCSEAAPVFPFDDGYICARCGAATAVIWPSAKTVEGVERLLMMRPNPNNRNWTPDETLHDLLFENGQHGIFAGLDEYSGTLLTVSDTEITYDHLPALQGFRRTELGR